MKLTHNFHGKGGGWNLDIFWGSEEEAPPQKKKLWLFFFHQAPIKCFWMVHICNTLYWPVWSIEINMSMFQSIRNLKKKKKMSTYLKRFTKVPWAVITMNTVNEQTSRINVWCLLRYEQTCLKCNNFSSVHVFEVFTPLDKIFIHAWQTWILKHKGLTYL